MKATKFTLNIEMNALSKEVFYGMLQKITEELENESVSGSIGYDDGDVLSWNITEEIVVF